jgi:hypothetical protein
VKELVKLKVQLFGGSVGKAESGTTMEGDD